MRVYYFLISLLLLSACQHNIADKHDVKRDAKSQNLDPERSIGNTNDSINRGIVSRIPPKLDN